MNMLDKIRMNSIVHTGVATNQQGRIVSVNYDKKMYERVTNTSKELVTKLNNKFNKKEGNK